MPPHTYTWPSGCREPVRSLVRDCYSFCRLAVLAAEEPSTSGEPPRSPSQQQEEQQQLDEFVTAVLVDDEPAEGSFAATAAPAAAQPPPAPAAGAAGAAAGSQQQQPAAADPSAAAAIWALHPCALASAAQPPALLGIPGNDERTAEIVCCACGACVAEFREEAAGRKLGMLTALQLYCVPAAAEVSAGVGTSEAAAAAAAVEEAAGAAAGAAAATAPPATPPPQRVCLAAGYEDGSVVVWDAAAPNAPWAQRQLCREPVTALAVDSACTGGAAGSAEYQLIVFKLDHAAGRISVRHSIELQKKGVGDVAVRPDRRLLAAAGWDGRVRLYKYRSGRQLALLKVSCGGWGGRRGWEGGGEMGRASTRRGGVHACMQRLAKERAC